MPAMQDLRNIVNQSGYGTRVSDQALNEIAQARDPRQAAEQLVTRLGGRPRDFTQVIDRIVQVCSENRTMQDAPAASEGDATVTEYADRLRTVAAGMGLPGDRVEEALRQAGMIPEPQTTNADADEDEDASVEEIGRDVVRLMKKMLKKLDKIANSL